MLHMCILTAGFVALSISSAYTFIKVKGKNLSLEETIPAVLFGCGLFGAALMLRNLFGTIIGGVENGSSDLLLTCMCWLNIVAGLLVSRYIRIHHVHRIECKRLTC